MRLASTYAIPEIGFVDLPNRWIQFGRPEAKLSTAAVREEPLLSLDLGRLDLGQCIACSSHHIMGSRPCAHKSQQLILSMLSVCMLLGVTPCDGDGVMSHQSSRKLVLGIC
ncbi:hypothetical protein Cni_G11045 [Canna indica]|uniref:Uncharacterized protein n=1 Tax=Canna indica TaxID=4628 RepID=A0AAQ3QAG6_9LILI|nr:hypothetical protein Cni_G11045 [Canna indica]